MLNNYNFNIRQYFNNSSLMLLIWNGNDIPTHLAGLEFLNKFVYHEPFKFKVLPMFRPFGRNWPDYLRDYELNKEMLRNDHTGYQHGVLDSSLDSRNNFEVWIQVLDSIHENVYQEIKEFIDRYNYTAVWKKVQNPIWRPLGQSFEECQYACAMNGKFTKLLCRLNQEDECNIPFLLKLIWFQSTLCSLKHFRHQNPPRLFDLRIDINKIIQIQRESLAEFDLGSFNFIEDNFIVECPKFGSSHLCATGFLSIINHRNVQRGSINLNTRPYFFPTINEYLNILEDEIRSIFS